MKTTALAAAAALTALSIAAPAVAFPDASAAQCAFYETVYAAVGPRLAEARAGEKPSAFATLALERAHEPSIGGPKALPGPIGPIVELAGCRTLVESIVAGGAPVRFSRPPILRQVEGPHIEYFSRPVTREGKTHVTYFVGRDAGVDVTLRQDGEGAWIVEAAKPWELVIVS